MNISGIYWHGKVEQEVTPIPTYYSFSISPASLAINYSAQTITFTATTDSPLWQVASVPSWMTYSGSTLISTGVWALEFEINENTGDTRVGVISISYKRNDAGNMATVNTSVVQQTVPPISYTYSISPTAATLNYSAQTITFTATTDSPQWQIYSVPSWMSYSGSSLIGTDTWKLEFEINENTGDTRNGNIVIDYRSDSAGGTATLQVGVEQEIAPPIPECAKIWYTSTNSAVVQPYRTGSTYYGASIVSNTYNDGQGIILFDNCVIKIGDYAFWYCTALSSITIPDSVTSIGDHAFENCTSLSSITIPEGIEFVGSKAFLNCTGVTEAYIPSTLTGATGNAFSGCTNLRKLTINCNDTQALNQMISGVTAGSNNYVKEIVYETGVTTAGGSYLDYGSATAITLPYTVTTVHSLGFYKKITMDTDALTSLRSGCNELIVGPHVTQIANSFAYNGNVTSITFDNASALISIGKKAFYSCDFSSITIPSSVTSIGWQAFWNIDDLSLVIINGAATIGKEAFYMCSITSLNMPNVVSIGELAFCYNGNLPAVVLPVSLTSIGTDAFSRCSSLNNIDYLGTMAQWNLVSKAANWIRYSPATVVHCTDGDVAI